MDLEFKAVQAMQFIECYLCDPITSQDIASQLCVSDRQLYRLFKDVTTDSIMNYVRCRRLTEASKELIENNNSITDIALKYQFNSPNNFCRAFSKLFWHSPIKFRRVGSKNHVTQRQPFDGEEFKLVHHGFKQNPKKVCLPKRHFVGTRYLLPEYGFRKNDNEYRKKVFDNFSNIENKIDECEWNIVFRTSQAGDILHVLENILAIKVSEISQHPDSLESFTFPKSDYLVFKHVGPEYLLDLTVSMSLSWLVKSSLYLNDAPTFFKVTNRDPFEGDLYISYSKVYISHLHWWDGYSPELTKNIGGNLKN